MHNSGPRQLLDDPRWRHHQIGRGAQALTKDGLLLALPSASGSDYSNSQLDDYVGLQRRDFPWRPPLTLRLRARFGALGPGTAGFGFWNNPLTPALRYFPAPPAAIWFFYGGPPNDIQLSEGVPGHGWKAQTLDGTTGRALRWAPAAPLVMLACRSPSMKKKLWPLVERDLAISDRQLPTPDGAWHSYEIEWRRNGARFAIDGATVLESERSPRGPLGFVAWIDNQWAVARPEGRLGYGLSAVERPQTLELADVHIG